MFIGVAMKEGHIDFEEVFSARKATQKLLIRIFSMRNLIQDNDDEVFLKREAVIVYELF
jgi:hypothetical protein